MNDGELTSLIFCRVLRQQRFKNYVIDFCSRRELVSCGRKSYSHYVVLYLHEML